MKIQYIREYFKNIPTSGKKASSYELMLLTYIGLFLSFLQWITLCFTLGRILG